MQKKFITLYLEKLKSYQFYISESVSDIDFLKGLIQPETPFEPPYIILESDVISRADDILSHASEFEALKRAFDSAFRAPEVEKLAIEDEDFLAGARDILKEGDNGLVNSSYQANTSRKNSCLKLESLPRKGLLTSVAERGKVEKRDCLFSS